MSKINELLQELESEAEATRRVLERIPTEHLGWRPHARSFTLGQLALHVATIPGAIAGMSRQSPLQVPKFQQPAATSAAELVPALDASLAAARRVLQDLDDAVLGETFEVVDGDRPVMTMPVGAVLRTIMLNHWYHHRGQLCVYLRQLEIKVPSVYGPSADENPFAAAAALASV